MLHIGGSCESHRTKSIITDSADPTCFWTDTQLRDPQPGSISRRAAGTALANVAAASRASSIGRALTWLFVAYFACENLAYTARPAPSCVGLVIRLPGPFRLWPGKNICRVRSNATPGVSVMFRHAGHEQFAASQLVSINLKTTLTAKKFEAFLFLASRHEAKCLGKRALIRPAFRSEQLL